MYIGVTGFTNREQVRAVLERTSFAIGPQLMVGVLMSYRTLRGMPASNPKRYPAREDVFGIFQESLDCLNLVHYNTREQRDLAHQLEDALGWAGPLCDGIQLNIAWPDPRAIQSLKLVKPRAKIVLQINSEAMGACDNDALRVASRVGEQYASLVDYVLVDFSGGKGEPLEPVHTMAYLAELRHQRHIAGATYQLGVAGGLCADNLNRLLLPIKRMMPNISIDAEGGLRTDDSLDIDKVLAYLDAAKSFFSRSDARF